jgi:hypothetical protein
MRDVEAEPLAAAGPRQLHVTGVMGETRSDTVSLAGTPHVVHSNTQSALHRCMQFRTASSYHGLLNQFIIVHSPGCKSYNQHGQQVEGTDAPVRRLQRVAATEQVSMS